MVSFLLSMTKVGKLQNVGELLTALKGSKQPRVHMQMGE